MKRRSTCGICGRRFQVTGLRGPVPRGCPQCRFGKRKLTAEQYRSRNLRAAFGITVQEYDAVLEHQGGRCGICEAPPQAQRLAVDHDHVTNRIRGLLCFHCNTLLGKAKDSVTLLRRAIEYLEQEKNSA